MSSRWPNLEYENYLVRCKALRNIPEIRTIGYEQKAVEIDREFTTFYWVARELIRNELAELVDEKLDSNEWTQIHFKERINPGGPPSPIADDFYPKAYQSFTSAQDLEEPANTLNRMKARYRDILASRINRISRLAAAEADSPTRPLQIEEVALYDKIHGIVSDWRDKMREIAE